jgi:putative flippase GtrA
LIRRLLLERKLAAHHVQPFVFVIVGAALAAVYFIIANVASAVVGLAPQRASGSAYLLMIPLAYYAHRKITFRATGLHRVALPRFVTTSFIGLFVSWAVPYVAVRLLAAPHWAAFLAVCIFVPIVSFTLMRFWVFVALRNGLRD